MAARDAAPPVARVLETALYFDDMPAAVAFYDDLFGFPKLLESERLVALDAGGSSVLLLFRRGGSVEDQTLPGGLLPGHDGSGPSHMAFAISADDLSRWERRLSDKAVELVGRVTWPRGGREPLLPRSRRACAGARDARPVGDLLTE